ncbi:hypothetical protein V1478_010250 [Vespula squamosa]|uniref:Uncharacterized protein n=1 Tax=Vespula squamosa TaxID=30214 RepID=A0ABD2AJ75_VESSQ
MKWPMSYRYRAYQGPISSEYSIGELRCGRSAEFKTKQRLVIFVVKQMHIDIVVHIAFIPVVEVALRAKGDEQS